MKIEIKLRIAAGDGAICEEEVLSLDKPHDQLEAIGLSLAEAKDLLGRLQEHIVAAQAADFAAERQCCAVRPLPAEQGSRGDPLPYTLRRRAGFQPAASPLCLRCRQGQNLQSADGALFRAGRARWDIVQSAETPELWIETFHLPSWAEHLEQHERVTKSDRELQDEIKALDRHGDGPVVRHYLAPE